MKQNAILVVTSLLSILLLTLHITDDIVRGISKAEPSNTALLVLVVFLYGTLVLADGSHECWRAANDVLLCQCGLGSPVDTGPLGNSEIQHLHEIVIFTVPADEDVGRFDVSMNESPGLGLGQGVAHLPQEVDRTLSRNRTEAPYQQINVESVEKFHHIIKGAVDRDAVIKELDCVR
jgi:hypothetical protein